MNAKTPWYKVVQFTVIGWWWRLERWYDDRFGTPTVEEAITELRASAQLDQRRAAAVIERHRFLEHMALNTLAGLKAWENQNPPF